MPSPASQESASKSGLAAIRRGRPPTARRDPRALRNEALLAVTTRPLSLSTVPVRRRAVQDELVCAFDRRHRDHGVTARAFCKALALSERTFRAWRHRPATSPAPPKPPKLPTPPRRGQGSSYSRRRGTPCCRARCPSRAPSPRRARPARRHLAARHRWLCPRRSARAGMAPSRRHAHPCARATRRLRELPPDRDPTLDTRDRTDRGYAARLISALSRVANSHRK